MCLGVATSEMVTSWPRIPWECPNLLITAQQTDSCTGKKLVPNGFAGFAVHVGHVQWFTEKVWAICEAIDAVYATDNTFKGLIADTDRSCKSWWGEEEESTTVI